MSRLWHFRHLGVATSEVIAGSAAALSVRQAWREGDAPAFVGGKHRVAVCSEAQVVQVYTVFPVQDAWPSHPQLAAQPSKSKLIPTCKCHPVHLPCRRVASRQPQQWRGTPGVQMPLGSVTAAPLLFGGKQGLADANELVNSRSNSRLCSSTNRASGPDVGEVAEAGALRRLRRAAPVPTDGPAPPQASSAVLPLRLPSTRSGSPRAARSGASSPSVVSLVPLLPSLSSPSSSGPPVEPIKSAVRGDTTRTRALMR